MLIDAARVWESLPRLLLAHPSPREVISEVIFICRQSRPHPDWARLQALDWAAGCDRVRGWVPELLQREPPPTKLSGLWLGLLDLDEDGVTRLDIHLVGTETYDPDDDGYEWTLSGAYCPTGYAHPLCLEQLYAIAYETGTGLGVDAEWALGLAFGCAATAFALQTCSARSIPHALDTIGVAAGFDDGDFLAIGELTAEGFILRPATT